MDRSVATREGNRQRESMVLYELLFGGAVIHGAVLLFYSDLGSHFFVTRKAGERVDPHRLTQVGRAMKELGVQMIPAYSPQARGAL
ncbi:MAG: hypothetical protein JO108_08535 [Acidobacteriaceae bacterium]|nr:hypothetical protein [Acidobacteriaceae bacterium]